MGPKPIEDLGSHITGSGSALASLGPDRRDKKKNAATGASAASARAVGSQLVAFYLRAPAKAFFRTRVDYLAFARAINPHFQAQESWSYRISTPGLLHHAVRSYGWSFIPNHVLPPLIANIGIGAVLYTTYLQTLGHLHHQSSQSLKRVFPPPSFQSTFTAGFLAGGIQSVVAAPLDALSIRFKTSEVLNGRYKNMWSYGSHKLRELGPRGIFAGWTLAFLKDSLGYGAFFATFEYVKSQAYYDFVVSFYDPAVSSGTAAAHSNSSSSIIKPHYALEPTFLMLAGISASITQQIFAYPLSRIANVHFTSSLEHLDRLAARPAPLSPLLMLRGYARAYERTFARCAERAKTGGGWRRWLYKAWLVNTIKQVPSTSAGLLIFEMVRRRYGGGESAGVVEWRGREISVA